jgi:serine/threonine-protein kinase HipA
MILPDRGVACCTADSLNPGMKHLMELAHIFILKNEKNIIKKVKKAVSRWPGFAKLSGVSQESKRLIGKTINVILKC